MLPFQRGYCCYRLCFRSNMPLCPHLRSRDGVSSQSAAGHNLPQYARLFGGAFDAFDTSNEGMPFSILLRRALRCNSLAGLLDNLWKHVCVAGQQDSLRRSSTSLTIRTLTVLPFVHISLPVRPCPFVLVCSSEPQGQLYRERSGWNGRSVTSVAT